MDFLSHSFLLFSPPRLSRSGIGFQNKLLADGNEQL